MGTGQTSIPAEKQLDSENTYIKGSEVFNNLKDKILSTFLHCPDDKSSVMKSDSERISFKKSYGYDQLFFDIKDITEVNNSIDLVLSAGYTYALEDNSFYLEVFDPKSKFYKEGDLSLNGEKYKIISDPFFRRIYICPLKLTPEQMEEQIFNQFDTFLINNPRASGTSDKSETK